MKITSQGNITHESVSFRFLFFLIVMTQSLKTLTNFNREIYEFQD